MISFPVVPESILNGRFPIPFIPVGAKFVKRICVKRMSNLCKLDPHDSGFTQEKISVKYLVTDDCGAQ
jgi:hypothetical protein